MCTHQETSSSSGGGGIIIGTRRRTISFSSPISSAINCEDAQSVAALIWAPKARSSVLKAIVPCVRTVQRGGR